MTLFGPSALALNQCQSFFKDFVGIGLLIFSGTQHGVRGLCSVVCNRAGFFGKKTIFPQKWEI